MSTLAIPRSRTARAVPGDLSRPVAHAIFDPEEVAWLAVEAAARLATNGGKSNLLRLDDGSPLARLAADRRLADLASALARVRQRAAAARVGHAATLPQSGGLELLVEIGGTTGLPGIVRTRAGDAAGDAVVVAVAFQPDIASTPSAEGLADVADGLWPPAAVVAG
jgi:hypothetical protein